ncbi:MAG: tetratricopeptide repeat protein [Gemmatimonadetes bacterium]|nr:tetratricopeptide repeat protein [Gemmatimonadota bacterium]NNM06930.1 tetratricopeptide repeat protein [Gemmatimonadota bacterium]
MGEPLEVHIRRLQDFYWSEEDPDGRGFVPLADALRKAGDLREANRLLRDGLSRHPDYLSGHVVAAWVSMDQGEPDEAETRFHRALELDPENLEALRGLADLLVERGEAEAALGFLDVLLGQDPLDPDLPVRIQDLRLESQAATKELTEPTESPSVWGDPEGVEDELDWAGATLQEDSSAPERTPGTAEDPAPAPGEGGEGREEQDEEGDAQVVEDGEPMPSPEDMEGALITSTLGEIYLRQGLFDRAEEVFQTLLEEDPGNQHLQHRLNEARTLLASRGTSEWVVEEAEPPMELGAAQPDQLATGEGEHEGQVLSVEALAPDRAEKGPGEPVGVDALAPDEVIPVDTLAPDEVIPVDALAPDEGIPVDALAPGELIPVDALAPDEVIPVDALAPDEVIPVDALAPGPDSDDTVHQHPGGTESGDDPTIDAFERWLENLQ